MKKIPWFGISIVLTVAAGICQWFDQTRTIQEEVERIKAES